MTDYNLDRFIKAQEYYFEIALSEIRAGRKRSHWMWYIFPQLKALGISSKAVYYGIADLEEAKAYMAEPYLRENLITITKALLALEESDPVVVMKHPDDYKLRYCMTLFEVAAPDVKEFGMVLDKFYGGVRDENTLRILKIIE